MGRVREATVSTLGEAARIYGERFGWRVLPLAPRDKRPILDDWPSRATTDPEQLAEWWHRTPAANVGIATGAGSGLFVLDVDGDAGEESLRELEAEHGPLPDTVESQTGSGGRHLLFRHPGVPVGNAVRLRDGLDIRGDGGQIVAPPSIHPNGREYVWEHSSRPGEVEVAEAPAWLLALVLAGGAARANGNGRRRKAADDLEPFTEGSRNDALFRLGCRLRRDGLGAAAIVAALLEENAARCQPPLAEHEVRAAAESAAMYAPGRLSPTVEDRPVSPGGGVLNGDGPAAYTPEVRVNGRQESEIVADAWAALIHHNRPAELFRHPELGLVRVRLDRIRQGATGNGLLHELTERELHSRLIHAARWYRTRQRERKSGQTETVEEESGFPVKLLGPMHADPTEELPELRRVVALPSFVGEHLELRDRAGYDQQTGWYFVGRPVEVGDVPPRPTAHDLDQARALLDDWLREFRFTNATARAHALGLLVTLLTRPAIAGHVPLFLIEAADPGTGKSYLAENMMLAAFGRKSPPVSFHHDGDKVRSAALSWCTGQEPVIYLDNLSTVTGQRSEVLSGMLTSGAVSDRQMREHRMKSAELFGVLVATANNLRASGEIASRVCRIRLESPVELGEVRRFEREDLETWTIAHRAELIRAVAVAVRAWQAGGHEFTRRCRFSRWSEVVGGIVSTLGEDLGQAFLAPEELAELAIEGAEVAEVHELVAAWAAAVAPGEPVTAADLLERLPESVVPGQVMGKDTDSARSRATRLGFWLRQFRGRVVRIGDGRRVRFGSQRDPRTKRPAWLLEVVPE